MNSVYISFQNIHIYRISFSLKLSSHFPTNCPEIAHLQRSKNTMLDSLSLSMQTSNALGSKTLKFLLIQLVKRGHIYIFQEQTVSRSLATSNAISREISRIFKHVKCKCPRGADASSDGRERPKGSNGRARQTRVGNAHVLGYLKAKVPYAWEGGKQRERGGIRVYLCFKEK